jgi:serine/threonine-protein kinase
MLPGSDRRESPADAESFPRFEGEVVTDTVREEKQVKPGDVLGGKFRIERVLGEGGMGIVCAATHLQLGQLVALKFMLRPALAHKENVARFEQEARAAVRLRSDHVAKVTDVGKLDDGAPYMVMEFLEGTDLDAVLEKQGPLPIATAVDYVLQACEAIAEAHELGIVHRDLKPKNLFLAQKLGGRAIVKVLDFGISKQMGVDDMSLTSTTHVLGSPNYMSPEQLRSSKHVDHRTDIWSLGAILFELLTGQVPFPAETVTALTAKVITEAPESLRKLRPDLPEDLRGIVLKCLEKSAEHRFQSVRELVAALTPFATAQQAAASAIVAGTSAPSLSSPAVPVAASSIPTDRPSIRTGNGNTDVAWDKTQLAEGQRRSRAPLFAALAAVGVVTLVGGIFAVKHFVGSGPTPSATVASSTTVTSTPTATATGAGAGGDLAGLPTNRDPMTPLVSPTGGPDRPLPGASATTTTRTPAGNVGARPSAAKDAGAAAIASTPPITTSSAVPTPPPTTTKTNDILPTSRN